MTDESQATDETVFRFFVATEDGRRSAEWRIWTAAEGRRPKDDVYLSPQLMINDSKISLHRDGMAQIGLSKAVRDQLRPGDKKALLRWEMADVEIVPGWKALYVLQFPESELEYLDSVPPKAIRIPAPGDGRSLHMIVMTSGPDATLPPGTNVAAMLNRGNGGHVALVVLETGFDPRTFDALKESQETSSLGWSAPSVITEREPFGWIVHRRPDDVRVSTEYSGLKRRPERNLALADFEGAVLPWAKKPPEVDHRDAACAILVCSRRRRPKLYVDRRSRCNHEHLASDAMDLVAAYDRGEIDSGWSTLRNGDHFTMISMREVLESKGLNHWVKGPGRQPR
ncbi:hypothetical protein ACSW29_27730 [Rhodococcus sp. GB-02]